MGSTMLSFGESPKKTGGNFGNENSFLSFVAEIEENGTEGTHIDQG